MKVLWFEVTEPAGYRNAGEVIGGWQDSLELIVRNRADIQLYVAFEGKKDDKEKQSSGVTYIPVPTIVSSFWERLKDSYTWKYNEARILSHALDIINEIQPDIIHIFGMEWPWGSIVKYTNIPCVAHIMGSMVPYYNAKYPPSYNKWNYYREYFPNICKLIMFVLHSNKEVSSVLYESKRWKAIKNYMGRTGWDHALVNTLHPNANYFHVDEALRPVFLKTSKSWKVPNSEKIRLVSTGCRNFWKGPDMMLKTAHLLKTLDVDFEWLVVGNFPKDLQNIVERKERQRFTDNGLKFLGFLNPEKLCDLLCESTIYVHTAYIENSPNSICEAQILGVPIVSTNVGGISTLLGNNGILVPANDPWQMANAIVELSRNRPLMQSFSLEGKKMATARHKPDAIIKDLMLCYNNIIRNM